MTINYALIIALFISPYQPTYQKNKNTPYFMKCFTLFNPACWRSELGQFIFFPRYMQSRTLSLKPKSEIIS
jgi:hypothetical protein